MKWITQDNLDKSLWDDLVRAHRSLLFNYSWYLDSLANDWGVLFTDETQKKGIAIAFTCKLNQASVYPPFFHRCSSWVGNWTEQEQYEAIVFLKNQFNGGILAVDSAKNPPNNPIYQKIELAKHFRENYHTQAQRMLKKANNNQIKLSNHFDKQLFVQLLVNELGSKDDVWHTEAVLKFENLIDALMQHNQFNFIEIQHNNKSVGGLIIMQDAQYHIYLKGACTAEVKKLGGMYLAMDKAIETAMQNNSTFDFGGSRIEGVARFNRNMGGQDTDYTIISWNNHPIWYNTIKKIRHSWKKNKK